MARRSRWRACARRSRCPSPGRPSTWVRGSSVAGPLDVVVEDGVGVVGEGARLVVGLDGGAEVVTGLVVAAVVPLGAGGPDEQAVVDSPARPRTVAAASAVRVVCGMRHLRPPTLATDPVRAPGAGSLPAVRRVAEQSQRPQS